MDFFIEKPLLLGCVSTAAGLRLLATKSCVADAIELRLDCLLQNGVALVDIEKALARRRRPVLLTPRAIKEGGQRIWSLAERRALVARLLPQIDALDIELASLSAMAALWREAEARRLALVFSAHALARPASDAQVARCLAKFPAGPRRVLKIASQLKNWRDLQRLAALLIDHPKLPLAVMGLGTYGAQSRGVLTALGSRLIYGYLDAPVAAGQPSAVAARQIIRDVRLGLGA